MTVIECEVASLKQREITHTGIIVTINSLSVCTEDGGVQSPSSSATHFKPTRKLPSADREESWELSLPDIVAYSFTFVCVSVSRVCA